jgi:hypothetical protein
MQPQLKISIIDLQVLLWGATAASGTAENCAYASLYLRLKRAGLARWRLFALHTFLQGQDG